MGKKITAGLDAILGFSILPLRMISVFGMIISLASLIYGFFIIATTLMGQSELRGFQPLHH